MKKDVILKFIKDETFSGILLIILTAAALLWTNSSFAESYFNIWHTHLLAWNLHFWINDILMAVFFLVVGLEIKRELISGELSNFKSASLPAAAALGGMIMPALIFVLFNFNTEYLKGWAIPTATDIAFSVGILALLGKSVPVQLKIFLVALAIVDDMGAVIIIALFYSSNLSLLWLAAALIIFLVQLYLNKKNIQHLFPYILTGVLLWIAFYKAGIHPTIAGVITASVIPENAADKTNDSPLEKLENGLHPWVTYLIIPVFAFSNAGVQITGNLLESFSNTLVPGIMLGLFIGKPLGITLFSYITSKMGLTSLPAGTNFYQVFGIGLVAGIGFTMSLFISNLAFIEGDAFDLSKIGILSGSILSGIAGYLFFKLKKKPAS